ncbi:composite domain of metallo-dependent hydrolase [Phellopilus nigrolimitatus]|nr:composite domain of metallo-dependent hydrolase [Phellopilus nigrolimitatus]
MDAKVVNDVEHDAATWMARRKARRHRPWPIFALALLTFFVLGTHIHLTHTSTRRSVRVPSDAAEIHARCKNLKLKPSPPPKFNKRRSSDRFVPGTKATLVKNATIWTGRIDGLEIIKGDLLLDKGIIKAIGHVGEETLQSLDSEAVTVNANGAWISPGIVDLHSHIGDDPSPELSGAEDDNSLHGVTQPWLRALDGLNTHDDSYHLSISGGVTTSLVLPGSANGIGGQGFVIKLRDTAERSPTSKLLEPPFTLNRSEVIDWSMPPRWRQMKHACGENPRRVYGNTRMDNIWAFREVYDKARQIKEKQDAYCSKVLSDEWAGLGAFPEELQWEALVDVLRGRVKVQVHCYEAVDLDDLVRLTNEFKFPIAAFHHAHETYLVPELLKKAYGHTPASAMFATNARYKREAYRGSEFAPRILADNGIQVVMKSDHPVLNSRFLLYEAQQAHYYGLPDNIALASVTTTPAQVMGMEHRIGLINEGYDADLVIWDSHPLALGATPKQVFIDGIAQLADPYTTEKPDSFQSVPKTPNFDKEAANAVKYEGLPPLAPEKSLVGTVAFTNVRSMTILTAESEGIVNAFEAQNDEFATIVVERGRVTCAGVQSTCSSFMSASDAEVVDLKGGAISPGLVSFGSPLGLEEIEGESSTSDGFVYDPLAKAVPNIVGGDTALIRAADGLQYATRDAYLGYRAGVTTGITAPKHRGFLSGLSTAFGLGAAHKLEKGALVQEVAAVHVTVGHMGKTPSISTQIAALRHLLLDDGGESSAFKDVAEGKMTLVVEAQSADVISTLLRLKKEVEEEVGGPMKMTIVGAAEAHLLAKDLATADVGVVVVPSRPFPYTWEHRRILPGPPLTSDSAISLLLAHNVTVGIGIEESWSVRNTRFDAAWAALEAAGDITKIQALALASSNLEKLLGLEVDADLADLVATEAGDMFDFESKVVGVISPRRSVVDLF